MTDYTNLIDKINIPELVKALRHCISDLYGFVECDGCPIFCKGIDCQNDLHNDAAAVIEELQNALADEYKDSEYIVSELESCVRTLTEQRDYWKDKAEKMEMQDESISKFADGEWYRNDKV